MMKLCARFIRKAMRSNIVFTKYCLQNIAIILNNRLTEITQNKLEDT